RLKTCGNLLLTMMLGGIWHGAGWKFVMWGALHGGGLAVERLIEPWLGRRSLTPAGKLVATLIVFHFVCFAWIFFRAEDFAMARLYIAGLGVGDGRRCDPARAAAPRRHAAPGPGADGCRCPRAGIVRLTRPAVLDRSAGRRTGRRARPGRRRRVGQRDDRDRSGRAARGF